MIIVLKQDAPDAQVREFCHELQDMGLQINDSKGSDTHILGLIGDTKAIAVIYFREVQFPEAWAYDNTSGN